MVGVGADGTRYKMAGQLWESAAEAYARKLPTLVAFASVEIEPDDAPWTLESKRPKGTLADEPAIQAAFVYASRGVLINNATAVNGGANEV